MHNRPQLVDQFIPAKPRPRPAAPAAVAKPAPAPVRPRSAVSIDGFVAKPGAIRPQPLTLQAKPQHKPHLQPHPMLQRQTVAAVAAAPAKPRLPIDQPQSQKPPHAHKPQPALRKHWHLGKLAIVGITLGVIFGSLSLFSLQLGQIVIAIYAIIAVWRRLPSRLTFLLALLMFGGIILTQLFTPDSGISENLAVYAFLLLCVGTLSLAREVRQDSGQAPASRY